MYMLEFGCFVGTSGSIGISNYGEHLDIEASNEKDEHPFAYYYDEENHVLILNEVKIFNGTLHNIKVKKQN